MIHKTDSFVLTAIEYSGRCLHLYSHSPKGGYLSCFKGVSMVSVMFYFWRWVGGMESSIYWSVFPMWCLKQSSSSRTPSLTKLPGLVPRFRGSQDFWKWTRQSTRSVSVNRQPPTPQGDGAPGGNACPRRAEVQPCWDLVHRLVATQAYPLPETWKPRVGPHRHFQTLCWDFWEASDIRCFREHSFLLD